MEPLFFNVSEATVLRSQNEMLEALATRM